MNKTKSMDSIEKYTVTEPISLSKRATASDLDITDEKAIKKLNKVCEKLSAFQDRMYAHNKYSVLICIQGMDTAGKDSLIREVFKEFNARGVVVQSFKKPTSTELEHDYLWRHYIALPERGKFSVFNRTHYENVLVSRVHPEIILNENLPHIQSVQDITENFWEKRYTEINAFEEHIQNNGVILFKFFLHLSKDEQKKRLLRRLNKGKHNWKFSPGDLQERAKWEEYQHFYELAIAKTATENRPWYVVPADSKPQCRFIFAKILEQVLCQYTDIKEPELDEEVKRNIGFYRDLLENE